MFFNVRSSQCIFQAMFDNVVGLLRNIWLRVDANEDITSQVRNVCLSNGLHSLPIFGSVT